MSLGDLKIIHRLLFVLVAEQDADIPAQLVREVDIVAGRLYQGMKRQGAASNSRLETAHRDLQQLETTAGKVGQVRTYLRAMKRPLTQPGVVENPAAEPPQLPLRISLHPELEFLGSHRRRLSRLSHLLCPYLQTFR